MSSLPVFDAELNDSGEKYFEFVHLLTDLAVNELSAVGHDVEKQKQAIKRYFLNSMKANLTVTELWDFLGVSNHYVLDRTGLFQTEKSVTVVNEASKEALADIRTVEEFTVPV